MKNLKYVSLALLLTLATSCRPCGCREATLVNPKGITLKITFDYSILPWVEDGFTITMIENGEVRTVHGKYKNSGDKTIRFDVDGDAPFLSAKSGEINSLSCDTPMKGQFTVTPPAPPGGVAVPLTFHCTKE